MGSGRDSGRLSPLRRSRPPNQPLSRHVQTKRTATIALLLLLIVLLLCCLLSSDVASMVKELGKKGITVKDEPGVSLVRLFGPGVGDEKVKCSLA